MARRNYQPRESRPQQEVEWSGLLEEALTAPGSLGNSYNRFYEYSFLNQILLLRQRTPLEPVATYKRWGEMNRQVKKGSKAKAILRPITVTLKDQYDDQGNEKKLTKFKMVNCIFPVSDTEGEELPEWEPPEWSEERTLGALAINRVAFRLFDGNTQGWSAGRDVAINPVAVYPRKTLLHELGHIVVGHTAPEVAATYREHRGLFEFQAEGTAYLVANELQLPEKEWNPGESRAYIQHWLRGEQPSDQSIRQVFSATDAILKAGREQELVTGE